MPCMHENNSFFLYGWGSEQLQKVYEVFLNGFGNVQGADIVE